jgi:phosphoglycolate phosphatase-like HAD superfamily hydrolase
MKLVIFDIDGTLTRTNAVDESCFERSVRAHLGIGDVVTDWGAYTHSTDSGILDELYKRSRGRSPTPREQQEFIALFVEQLKRSAEESSSYFESVPGATSVWNLLQDAGYATSLATGAWKNSAQFKLAHALKKDLSLPHSTADDHFSRDDIIKQSILRAGEYYKCSSFEDIVYFGDGPWDCISARRVGVDFVGVLDGRSADRLESVGATTFLTDYSQPQKIMETLQRVFDKSPRVSAN